jgi:hypothetical protein
MLPTPEATRYLHHQLHTLRLYLAGLKSSELADLEALLSVAQAELSRATATKAQQSRS